MIIKLLQWNVMYSEDIGKIGEFIRLANADIVCLQELTNGYHAEYTDTGKYLADTFGYHSFYAYGPMVLPDGTEAEMGMGIFSKHPLSAQQKLVLQEGVVREGKITQDERFYLQADVELQGRTLTVSTTHLPFHPTFRTTLAKQQMVEAILSNVPLAQDYVLAGDFNTTPRTKAATSFRKNGLKNAGPALTQPTWTTKPFTIGAYSYQALQYRLDYILYKGSLKPLRSSIPDTELSDHVPLLVDFEL